MDQIHLAIVSYSGQLVALVGSLCAGFGLYLLWKLIEKRDHLAIQGRAKRKQTGEEFICRWFFSAAGELIHIRCRRSPRQD